MLASWLHNVMWLQSLLITRSPLLVLTLPPSSIKRLPLSLMSSCSSLSLSSFPPVLFSLLFHSLSFLGLHACSLTCCVFIIAKAMLFQNTVTHPALSQSISSHNPFIPSSVLPEHCWGCHRCGARHPVIAYSHPFDQLWVPLWPLPTAESASLVEAERGTSLYEYTCLEGTLAMWPSAQISVVDFALFADCFYF